MPSVSPSRNPKREVVAALTQHVRVLTVDQIARTWWPHTQRPRSNALKGLADLEGRGLVETFSMMAQPEIDLPGPVFVWRPGDPEPDFRAIASRLRARWKRPRRPTDAVIATRRAARDYGGYLGGRRPRASEATHDLHLAQVYLRMRRESPELLEFWVSEAQQYAEGGGRNEPLPDVIIRPAGAAQFLVEFAGQYSRRKLEEFHGRTNHIPYQLW